MHPLLAALMAMHGGGGMGGGMSPMNSSPGVGALPFPHPGLPINSAGTPSPMAMLSALGGQGASGGPQSPINIGIGMGRIPIRPTTSNISPVGKLVRDHFARQAVSRQNRGLGARTTLGGT